MRRAIRRPLCRVYSEDRRASRKSTRQKSYLRGRSLATSPWVRKFRSRNREWPANTYLYVFATNSRCGRKSSVSGFYEILLRRINVVAEFTFWPLGTVLSFGQELTDARLTPIHQWSQFDYDYQGAVHLQLTVNPVATAYPLDFRTRDQVYREAEDAVPTPVVPRSAVEDLAKRVTEQSGEVEKEAWRWMVRQRPRLSD